MAAPRVSRSIVRLLYTPSRGYSSSSLTDDLLHNMHQQRTWDRFYIEKKPATFCHFDWFFNYKHVSGFLQSFLHTEGSTDTWHVIDVGCGTSDLGLGLYRDSSNPVHISCVDFSPVAIHSMQEYFATHGPTPLNPDSALHYKEADATNLVHVGANTFHLVLDKGTIDALLRSTNGVDEAGRMLAECLRILKRGGSLLQFSDEDPDARMSFLENKHTSNMFARVQDLGTVRGISYYAYILTIPPKSS